MTNMRSRSFAAIAALAITAGAGNASASKFPMGGYQTTSTFYTAIETVFIVPQTPQNFSSSFAIWTGLSSKSHVIQVVLAYFDPCNGGDNGPCPGWYMWNEVEPGGLFGNRVAVNPGEEILAEVWIDSNNPTCNGSTGANCNYFAGWEDLSNTNLTDTGFSASGQSEFMSADPAYIGYGLVLETGNSVPNTYNDCTDFPAGGTQAQTELFQFAPNVTLYNPVATNLRVGIPQLSATFSDQPFTNGGSFLTSCNPALGVGIASTDVGSITMNF